MPVSVSRNIELLTHALSGNAIIFIPDKRAKILDSPEKYRTLGNPDHIPHLGLQTVLISKSFCVYSFIYKIDILLLLIQG